MRYAEKGDWRWSQFGMEGRKQDNFNLYAVVKAAGVCCLAEGVALTETMGNPDLSLPKRIAMTVHQCV